MLMRSFSRREKVLLLVLVLVMLMGLYVLAVHNPVKANLAQLAQEKEDLELKLQVTQVKLGQYKSMKAELEEIFAMPEDQLTVMPPYDNTKALMVQLNHILGELEYDLNFSEVKFNENVATRAVQFTFDAPSYEEARAIIQRLTHTGNRSLMNTLTIAPTEDKAQSNKGGNINLRSNRTQGAVDRSQGIRSGPQTVSGTITFYELAPQKSAGAQSED